MDPFTKRNLVILALAQLWVIVAGVLTAGVSARWYTTFGMPMPSGVALTCDYGWLTLAMPLVWVAVAVWQFDRWPGDDRRRLAAAGAGVLLLAVVLAGAWYGGGRPWVALNGCGLGF